MIVACVYRDGSVDVLNVSPAVVRVGAPEASRIDVTTPQRADSDLPAVFSDELVRGAPVLGGNVVRLAPGATATALRAGGATEVYAEIDTPLTAEKYFVEAAARWVQSKLTTPDRQLASSAASCARQVSALWNQTTSSTGRRPPVEVTLIDAIASGRACSGLAREVSSLENRPPPAAATLGDEMRQITRGLGSTLIDDLLAFARRILAAT